LLDRLEGLEALTDADLAWLERAAASDAWWWAYEFSIGHDPSGLLYEENTFRYRPVPSVLIRVDAGTAPVSVARLVAAARCCGVPVSISATPETSDEVLAVAVAGDLRAVREPEGALAVRLQAAPPTRLRCLAPVSPTLARTAAALGVHVETEPPIASGRIELLRWLREQAISRTRHRYGNLLG
jgi:RHH-type proline utilization regulon transcriptional repressor/proline dehydrogenase/delta 1-pyrroline-5-carboxylate dehydrogenase